MKTILIGALVLILLVAGVFLYRDYFVKRKFKKLAEAKYQIVAPLLQKLAAKELVAKDEILVMAKDPALRHGVFRALETYNQSHLFPVEYLTREKGAEGFLVNWLEFPTELGTSPDEIELFTKVTLNKGEALDYYVFKYKTKMPHWVGQHNWMIGVSGPYQKGSEPYDVPLRVFSRFNTLDSISAESEVQWVHENINPIIMNVR